MSDARKWPDRDDDTVFLVSPDNKLNAVYCDAATGQIYTKTGAKKLAHNVERSHGTEVYGPFVAGKLIVFESLGEMLHPQREILQSYLYSKLSGDEKARVNAAYQNHYGTSIAEPLPHGIRRPGYYADRKAQTGCVPGG